jgi:hypothetical protein
METATWLAVFILGPGSVGIFIWFLTDLGAVMAPQSRKRPKHK